ncbi:hypothetical protein HAX54_038698 [Datura stramonium]|uniref:Uncharacterized protein n=1 Tax=Datura stramonium TaxID=4076 RepID=A0ABS8RN07_DATST|nr:hypothetical protein [Datura stramonium]
MEDKIREIRPDCGSSDMLFPWTVDIALELNIPRLLFNQSSYMYNSILHNLKLYKPHEHLINQLESQIIITSNTFSVPGLPDKIEFKLSQLTDDLKKSPAERFHAWNKVPGQVRDSEDRSYGIVHDTFYELEPAYADYYQEEKENQMLEIEWLNEQKHKSVLYVSFGSSVRFPEDQLTEIAKALEASERPLFIWPGGFMSHCGWNSVLEAIVAGVPLLTCRVRGAILQREAGSEKIKEAIEGLMSGSKESQKIREKAMGLSKMAKNAVEEGGSSWNNLTALIEAIKNFTSSSSNI